MSDLIDRQALLKQIDIDSDGEPGYYGDTWKFIDTIKNMPNVHDLPKDTDTISRQAAIEALRAMQTYKLFAGDDMLLIDQAGAQTELMMLPPAQPTPSQVTKDIARLVENEQDMRVIGQERIRGHWIIRETSSGDTEARCSHCGFTTLVDEPGNGLHMVSDLNFCPNCGAEMEK